MSKQTEAMKLAQDWYDSGHEDPDEFTEMIKQVIALAEQPAQQKPLTDEQIIEMYNEPRSDAEMLEFARAIEAAHGIKEKNNG